jgi:hypothetical protein
MDRYLLARLKHLLVFANDGDISKYGTPEDEHADIREAQEKADLCLWLVKRNSKGMSEKEITLKAVELMHKSMGELNRMAGRK